MTLRHCLIGGLTIIAAASPAISDMISPSHNCPKPMKPSYFATQAEQSAFERQIGAYRRCLSEFINVQNKEVRMHSEAARKATEELKAIRN